MFYDLDAIFIAFYKEEGGPEAYPNDPRVSAVTYLDFEGGVGAGGGYILINYIPTSVSPVRRGTCRSFLWGREVADCGGLCFLPSLSSIHLVLGRRRCGLWSLWKLSKGVGALAPYRDHFQGKLRLRACFAWRACIRQSPPCPGPWLSEASSVIVLCRHADITGPSRTLLYSIQSSHDDPLACLLTKLEDRLADDGLVLTVIVLRLQKHQTMLTVDSLSQLTGPMIHQALVDPSSFLSHSQLSPAAPRTALHAFSSSPVQQKPLIDEQRLYDYDIVQTPVQGADYERYEYDRDDDRRPHDDHDHDHETMGASVSTALTSDIRGPTAGVVHQKQTSLPVPAVSKGRKPKPIQLSLVRKSFSETYAPGHLPPGYRDEPAPPLPPLPTTSSRSNLASAGHSGNASGGGSGWAGYAYGVGNGSMTNLGETAREVVGRASGMLGKLRKKKTKDMSVGGGRGGELGSPPPPPPPKDRHGTSGRKKDANFLRERPTDMVYTFRDESPSPPPKDYQLQDRREQQYSTVGRGKERYGSDVEDMVVISPGKTYGYDEEFGGFGRDPAYPPALSARARTTSGVKRKEVPQYASLTINLTGKWARDGSVSVPSDPKERERLRKEAIRKREEEERRAMEEEKARQEENKRRKEEEKRREEEEERERKAKVQAELRRAVMEKERIRREEEEEERRKKQELEERKRLERERRLEEHRKLEAWRKEREAEAERERRRAEEEERRKEQERLKKIELAEKEIVHLKAKEPAITTGTVTIQFPDSPFWKRRHYKVVGNTLYLYRSEKEKVRSASAFRDD